MKKIIPVLIIGILVLSGLGAVAIESNNGKPVSKTNENVVKSSSPRDYTHTVFVEVGTATWCSACPQCNSAWHTIYEGGNYDFEYVELVYDKNAKASTRFYQFNPRWVPTSYWDGGEYVYPGTSVSTYYNYLDASGSRVVPDLVATLDVTWQDTATLEIDYNVDNNEATSYPGHLRIYVLELVSTLWNDYSGHPYYHAFLDFSEDKAIDIPASGSISDTIVWDGAAAGYPGITKDNIQVILAVFDDEGHTSYSDPPSGNPFTAYYSDECVAALPGGSGTNEPPSRPEISGPHTGVPDTSYDFTFTSTDPEEDDIRYYVLWGDGLTDYTDYAASGETVTMSHTYTKTGTFQIKVRAEDTNYGSSDYETFEIVIPRSKQANSFLQILIERFSNTFPILRQILNYL